MTEGHPLIISNRHFPDYFSATPDERTALWAMVDEAKKLLDGRFNPDGYNVGVNVGPPRRKDGHALPHSSDSSEIRGTLSIRAAACAA